MNYLMIRYLKIYFWYFFSNILFDTLEQPLDYLYSTKLIFFFQQISFTDMRRDVQEIFRNTPHGKQVMMFSATLSKEIRPVCKKFMQDVIEVH